MYNFQVNKNQTYIGRVGLLHFETLKQNGGRKGLEYKKGIIKLAQNAQRELLQYADSQSVKLTGCIVHCLLCTVYYSICTVHQDWFKTCFKLGISIDQEVPFFALSFKKYFLYRIWHDGGSRTRDDTIELPIIPRPIILLTW